MAVTVETGAGIPLADSYATAAELVSRAAAYGWTIPATAAEQEVLLRRASEAMNALGWKGSRVSSVQPLAWPREAVYVDGELIASTLVPAQVQYGQMALAAEIYADDLSAPETAQGAVVETTVDVITVKYATVNNAGKVLRAAPDRPSAVQFADFLQRRGLFAVRA